MNSKQQNSLKTFKESLGNQIAKSTTKNLGIKQALDVLLLSIIIVGLLIVVIVFYSATCTSTACGDMILFALTPLSLLGPLLIAYFFFDIYYLIKQSRHHEPIAKRHIATVLLMTAGLIWYTSYRMQLSSLNGATDAQHLSQYKENGGPTAAQKAMITLGNLRDAESLISSCSVSTIGIYRYDTDGPFEEKNEYIYVGVFPQISGDIFLPISDLPDVHTAAKNQTCIPKASVLSVLDSSSLQLHK